MKIKQLIKKCPRSLEDVFIEKITKLAISKLGGKNAEDIKNKVEEITKLSFTEENLSKILKILEELPINNIYRLEEKDGTISLWQIVSSLFFWGWILILLFLPFIYYEEFMEKIDNPYGTLIYILATTLYLFVPLGILFAFRPKWTKEVKQPIIKKDDKFMKEKNNKTISLWQTVFIWTSIWFLILFFFLYGVSDKDANLPYALLLSIFLSIPLGILFAFRPKWTKEVKQPIIKKPQKIKQLIIKLYFLIKRYMAEMFVILGAYLVGINSTPKQQCDSYSGSPFFSHILGGGEGETWTCWNTYNKGALGIGWIILALGIVILANRYLPRRDKK
ncbi:MAG: hypothetical protein PHE59_00290 [Patescibacteria group bacterium]|nr:hypothetical protein [Patescibacteria group bacterium]MDD5164445.1 hypothetical protein [Patescibacteria group bacterium]MDD5534364.1 hypothetical protein [Patescibacteria group bacterium]